MATLLKHTNSSQLLCRDYSYSYSYFLVCGLRERYTEDSKRKNSSPSFFFSLHIFCLKLFSATFFTVFYRNWKVGLWLVV
ncbi:hypothetical protein IMY05_019G0109200 [Salix suchowensis]|nr:hypothetical protein IMY05_019G0109200 [Salix suchowensis]